MIMTRDQWRAIAEAHPGESLNITGAELTALLTPHNGATHPGGRDAPPAMPPGSTARQHGDELMDTSTSKAVIVRTFSAGVHYGRLVSRDGKEVTLEGSRRIWRWYGANTLSEIATAGLDAKRSRVAAPVSIVLTEAIEIIDCTDAAVESIESAQWAA